MAGATSGLAPDCFAAALTRLERQSWQKRCLDEGQALAEAMRHAHGTPEFVTACTAYRDQLGFPNDSELLGLFLDSGEHALVVGALEAVLAGVSAGEVALSKGLRSQLAMLAEDFDATIADIAEEILEQA